MLRGNFAPCVARFGRECAPLAWIWRGSEKKKAPARKRCRRARVIVRFFVILTEAEFCAIVTNYFQSRHDYLQLPKISSSGSSHFFL